MELSDDKIVELFYVVGGVSSKVDTIYGRLIGEGGDKGEIATLHEKYEEICEELRQEREARIAAINLLTNERAESLTVVRTKKKMTAAIWGGLAIAGDLLYHGVELLFDYLKHKGGK